MASTWIIVALLVFYAGIVVASAMERNWWRCLYFVAAILIQIAVLGMSNAHTTRKQAAIPARLESDQQSHPV